MILKFKFQLIGFAKLDGAAVKILNYGAAAKDSKFFVSFQFIGL